MPHAALEHAGFAQTSVLDFAPWRQPGASLEHGQAKPMYRVPSQHGFGTQYIKYTAP